MLEYSDLGFYLESKLQAKIQDRVNKLYDFLDMNSGKTWKKCNERC